MSRRSPSQRDRVLAALRRAGRHGLTQIDFDAPDVVDRGRPIKRVAARVGELRERGHRIDSRREPNGMARYVLETEAGEGVALAAAADVRVDLTDFDLPAAPASPYNPLGDWA